jgi:abhydrolase domain-containing protein 8
MAIKAKLKDYPKRRCAMEKTVEIRPGRIINMIIEENPKADTALFFIHGMGGRSGQWREQIKFFRNDYTLIAPDLLGHGKSDKPRPHNNTPYAFMEFILDLQEIFNQYALKKNIIFGHSYGGALAAWLTFENQQQVTRQVLIAPSRCKPFTEIPGIYRLPVWLLELMRPLLEQSFRKFAFAKNVRNKVIEEEYRASKRNRLYVIKDMLEGMKDIPLLAADKLQTPSLILTGASDKIIAPGLSQNFYEKLPHHSYCMVDKSGHMLQLEQPSTVNELIEIFLEN